ncbi:MULTISPECIES: response regulator transcription factor [unclassified Leifsonia]|uniref:response regulator transcription factor n=1 Tax=unclassified Leifsonia TaxID=2663824 RepID=UPI000A19507B|nr:MULTISPECIES: response regulator transcription factor [unclassified Leifsonia]QJA00248.1 response regulator transcription factor [Leifsonia sp. PS1209]
MERERQRVLLVEDDQRLGPLIEQVLAETYEVTLIADGDAGLRAGLDGTFDAIVVDRRLPGTDGVTIVETLRARRVVTPILMLTALGGLADRVGGLDAGANDYLVKPFEFDELLARLRAITRTFTGEGPVIAVGDWQFYPESRCIYSPYDGRIQLTARETALLRLLAENPLRTFSRRQILSEVFENDEQPGTVDTYVHYVRRKTDKDLISTVRGEGYRLGAL